MSKNDSSDPKKTLFLDIGNSSIKVAFRNNNAWEKSTDNFKSVTYLISWLNQHKDSIQDLVVASVRKDHFELLKNQVTEFEIKNIEISEVPEHNLNYETPKTLGIDRFLGCLGAYAQEKQSVVVVDAGSACTIDIMNENGVYQGGVRVAARERQNRMIVSALDYPVDGMKLALASDAVETPETPEDTSAEKEETQVANNENKGE